MMVRVVSGISVSVEGGRSVQMEAELDRVGSLGGGANGYVLDGGPNVGYEAGGAGAGGSSGPVVGAGGRTGGWVLGGKTMVPLPQSDVTVLRNIEDPFVYVTVVT